MKTRSKILLIVIVILAIALGVVAWMYFNNSEFDSSAKQGSRPGKSTEAIENDKNAKVADGQMNVSITDTLYVVNGEATANIENIEANKLNQRVKIVLDNNNQEIYSSGLIMPGQYVDKIPINAKLEPGKYNATVTFAGVDSANNEQGSVQAKIKVVVK